MNSLCQLQSVLDWYPAFLLELGLAHFRQLSQEEVGTRLQHVLQELYLFCPVFLSLLLKRQVGDKTMYIMDLSCQRPMEVVEDWIFRIATPTNVAVLVNAYETFLSLQNEKHANEYNEAVSTLSASLRLFKSICLYWRCTYICVAAAA